MIVPAIIHQEDDRALEYVLQATDTNGSRYADVTNAENSVVHANKRGPRLMLARFLQMKVRKKQVIVRM